MNWEVVSLSDFDDKFTVEGDNYGEAAFEALQELGYGITIPDSEEEDKPEVVADA